mgnify:CR=1 FL=1
MIKIYFKMTMKTTCLWTMTLKMSKQPSFLNSNRILSMVRRALKLLVEPRKEAWTIFQTPCKPTLDKVKISLNWGVNNLRISILITLLNRNNELQVIRINSKTNLFSKLLLKQEKLVQLPRWRLLEASRFLNRRKHQLLVSLRDNSKIWWWSKFLNSLWTLQLLWWAHLVCQLIPKMTKWWWTKTRMKRWCSILANKIMETSARWWTHNSWKRREWELKKTFITLILTPLKKKFSWSKEREKWSQPWKGPSRMRKTMTWENTLLTLDRSLCRKFKCINNLCLI